MIIDPPRCMILIVDDEQAIRRALTGRLVRDGHDCREAANADEAIEQIHKYKPLVVILDIMMPGRSGDSLLDELSQSQPDIAVIMATAVQDINTVIRCMKSGAKDYITKPFDLEQVVRTVERVAEKKRLEIQIIEYHKKLTEEVQESRAEVRKVFLNSIESLVYALEAKDKYTAGHSRRVAAISVALGAGLRLSEEDKDSLQWAALLHDTGKIYVDRSIMNKPGPLTAVEYKHVMTHVTVGASIVRPMVNQQILDIILHHHDFYNGEGFEQTVKGEEIPLGARIVAVADSFDAMTSDRPYRSALSVEKGVEEIKRCSGTQFDPLVVQAFVRIHLPQRTAV